MSSPPERRDLAGLAVLLPVLVTAVPAAVFVVPDTASYVVPQAIRDLGLADGQAAAFVRACGLALPALLLCAPPAAVLARRLPAWAVLFAGLAVMLGAEAAAGYATSVPLVGGLRVLQGAGAGAVLPAAFILAWERRERRVAAGVWAGALIAALMAATPAVLAVTPRPDPYGREWRAVLHPYWWLGAVALVGAGLLGVLRLRGPRAPGAGRPDRSERVLLMLPVAPSAGFAFLAVVTTYDWSPGAQLILAACAIAGLLGLALVSSRGGVTGSPLGYAVVMIAVGLVSVPVTGPLAALLDGPAASSAATVVPFAAGAGCAALAVLTVTAPSRAAGRRTILVGYGLVLTAIALLLTARVETGTWALYAALGALGAGAGLAAATALRPTEVGSGLFGLTLCLPAVLGGHMVVGSLQVARVGLVTGEGATDTLAALTEAYRMWLVVAAAIVVILAAATAWAGRRRRPRTTGLAATAAPAKEETPAGGGEGPALQAS
jgi:MFS family permease